jgi:hypothetical protein
MWLCKLGRWYKDLSLVSACVKRHVSAPLHGRNVRLSHLSMRSQEHVTAEREVCQARFQQGRHDKEVGETVTLFRLVLEWYCVHI